MKTIGLIGGMSWKSTVTYYQILNETIKQELGGLHSAKVLLYSVDFAEIKEHLDKDEWEKSAEVLSEAAANLEKAGADYIIIGTNTMHKLLSEIQRNISIPIIHIAEVTADELKMKGISKVGLLGTKYTMIQSFYKNKLIDAGIEVVIPNQEDIVSINDIIYNELCLGIIAETSRQKCLNIIDRLEQNGAQGVILGCTEIGLLIQQEDTKLPIFDTTRIHAEKAALLSIE